MAIQNRLTPKRIAAFLLSGIIPLGALCLGIICTVFGDLVFNSSILTTFVILPVVALVLLFLTVFSNKRAGLKVVFVVVILLLFALVLAFSTFLGKFESIYTFTGDEVRERYPAEQKVVDLMPALSDLGDPAELEYHNYASFQLIFFAESNVLICGYGDDSYESQKATVEEKYVFYEDMMGFGEGFCKATATVDGFSFRVLKESYYSDMLTYPKTMLLIGTNDSTREIAYVAFNDTDLDYIDSLDDFICSDCGWDWIR